MNDCKGGSELTYNKLISRLSSNLKNKINIVLNCNSNINKDLININWQQLSFDQPCLSILNQIKYDYYIFVSNWQYDRFRLMNIVDMNKSSVIKNAIDYIPYQPKEKTNKLKLIYTSTPWRGLEILLDSFELLDRNDVELHVYSSTIIYGKQYDESFGDEYKELYQRCISNKNIKYHGFASNDEVVKSVQSSHIFSYPNIWEETSCMSALEAAMSGCDLVTTNYGALYETLSDWSTYVRFTGNKDVLVKEYTRQLNENINNFWKEETQERLYHQHKYYKTHYSWDVRIKEWEKFLYSVINQNKPIKKIPQFSFM